MDYDQALGLVTLVGQAIFIYGPYTLQADSIVWDARWRRLEASGHVRFQAPEFSLEAAALRFSLAEPMLEVEQARIEYLDTLVFEAQSAMLLEQIWTATGVQASPKGFPLRFQAQQARFFPQLYRYNLLLENISWVGFPLIIPQAILSVETGSLPNKLPLETTLDTGFLTPRLAFEEGQLKLETRLRLYEDSLQRLDNFLDYRPDRGWQEGLGYQWRPTEEWLLQSNLVLLPQLRSQQQVTYRFPGNQIGQLALGLNEDHRFERLFYLPLRLSPPQPFFAQALYFSNLEPLGDWPFDTRYYLGLGYGSESHWLGAAALEAVTHPLRWGDSFWLFNGKMAYLGLSGQHLFTAGGRLLWESRPRQDFHYGLSLDKWFASLPEGWLTKADLLLWRIGHYLIFYPIEPLAFGLLAEVTPHPFRFVTLDALISYRHPPLTGNLLLQALPLGAQARVDFEFF